MARRRPCSRPGPRRVPIVPAATRSTYPRTRLVQRFSWLLLPFSFFVLVCDGKLALRMTYLVRLFHPRVANGLRPTARSFDLPVRPNGEGCGFADGRVLLRD